MKNIGTSLIVSFYNKHAMLVMQQVLVRVLSPIYIAILNQHWHCR